MTIYEPKVRASINESKIKDAFTNLMTDKQPEVNYE